MKKRTMLMVCGMGFFLTANSFAQQFQEKEEVDVATGTDAGVKAVYEAQEKPLIPPQQKADSTTPINAKAQIDKFIEKHGFDLNGWDDKKGRVFTTGLVEFDITSPSEEPNFLVKREMATKQAVLEAKIKIIESINSNMSASQKLTMPGSDLNEKFKKEFTAAQESLDKMKGRLKRLKMYMDDSELAALEGVTWSDRGKVLLDKIIKKLDKKFDSGQIEAKKRKKYQKNKAAYEKQLELMKPIDQKVKAMGKPAGKTQVNIVKQTAKMPLFGATVIAQAESWNYDDEKYQVVVLVCWSNTLHRAARAIATGEDFRVAKKKKNKGTVKEWLKKQNLATMAGPRQYMDGDGKRWFIGITARALPKSSLNRERARGLANLNAKAMAVFSIYSDLASQKTAGQMMETRTVDDADVSTVAESFSKMLTNEFKNKTVRGMSQIGTGSEMIHPISGEKIYVAVFGINPSYAKTAMALEAKNYATAVQSNKYQSKEKGRKAGLEASVKESENDKASYDKGYKGGKKDVSDEIAKREAVAQAVKQAKAKRTATKVRRKKEEAARQSQEGVFMGDTDVDDDF